MGRGPDGGVPGIIPPNSDILRNPERPFEGQVIFLTGGSRDIGAGIATELLRGGATVIATYRDPEKYKRRDALIAQLGNDAERFHLIETDFQTQEGRVHAISETLQISGGKLSHIILNSSGDNDVLNTDTSRDIINGLGEHVVSGGSVIRIQSIPGHFEPKLSGLFSIFSRYQPVAEAKYRDEQYLRSQKKLFEEKGKRLVTVSLPIVKDTSNVRLLFGRAAQKLGLDFRKLHEELSKKLGLPTEVTIQDVSGIVSRLLRNTDIRNGHSEFGVPVEDAFVSLQKFYGDQQIYVDTLERAGEENGEKRAIGRAIISKEQSQQQGDRRLISLEDLATDENGNTYGKALILPEDAQGHFKDGSGFPRIFPGHKEIRAARECIEAFFGIDQQESHLRIHGFESVEFKKVIRAEGNTTILIKPENVHRDGDQITCDVTVLKEGADSPRAIIKGLELKVIDGFSKGFVSDDQVIEGFAQAIGVTNFDQEAIDNGSMPLFSKIGKTRFTEYQLAAGDGARYETRVRKEGAMGFNGSCNVYADDGRLIATTENVEAVMLPQKLVPRFLRE